MVERGLVETRPQAADLIERRLVLVRGSIADKPARLVAADDPIELRRPLRFVSRGGDKLAAALERFTIRPRGMRVLDAGASTGGFTDCLLQAGATTVIAVDVGHGQLHQRLRSDPRVVNRERTDIRDVTLDTVEGRPVDLVTADLSFISVARAVPTLTGRAVVDGAPVVLLVKPQFEAGRVEVSRGRGVIRDRTIHRRALGEVARALTDAGAAISGVMPSPITGRSGNIEFLLAAVTRPTAVQPRGSLTVVDAMLDAAVAEAHDHRAGGGN